MIASWRLLLDEMGLEPAILLILYVALVIACVLALIAQLAWMVAKRIRPRRDLEQVAAQRRKELDSAMNLTERGR